MISVLTKVPSGPMMRPMNKTNTSRRINTKALRATCPHANVIELDDRVRVCVRCEAVLR